MQELERVQQLGDHALLTELTHSAKQDRQLTVRLLAELGEVHARGLFRELGFASMFDYATRKLGMSEAEAALRLRAAKLGRAFPVVLEMLGRSELNLTTLSLLAPLLTADTLVLLHEARFKSKQQVLALIAKHAPKPDVPDSIRRLPRPSVRAPHAAGLPAQPLVASSPTDVALRTLSESCGDQSQADLSPFTLQTQPAQSDDPTQAVLSLAPGEVARPVVRSRARPIHSSVVPLSPERHKISFSASQRVCDMLEQARDLRRHRYPAGDLEPLFERALELLIAEEQRRRFGLTDKPRTQPKASNAKPQSRHIPNAVRREVWIRDGGRCSFRGADHQRCNARSPLEFHHVVPFALGGAHKAENIVLLCRAHNSLCAERDYGREYVQARIAGSSCRTSGLSRDPWSGNVSPNDPGRATQPTTFREPWTNAE